MLHDFAQGFSAPLVGIFVLGGLAFGVATAPTAPAGPGADATPAPTPGATPTPSQPSGGLRPDEADLTPPPAGGASASDVRARLAAGELRLARAWAREAGLAELHEEAHLLWSLTRSVREGPFAKAERFLLVDETLGAIRQETDDAYWIEPIEGGEEAIEKDRRGLRELDRDAGLAELARSLQASRRDASNGLALHRLAFLAFRAGLRDLGVEVLRAALLTAEGPILVDMFAGSDDRELDRLHRARDLLAGEDVEPLVLAEPVPSPVDTAQPPPTAAPAPSASADPLDQDASWRQAEAAYRQGLELYRSAFSASITAGSPAVRQAMTQFRQAQDLLDPMIDGGWDGRARQRIERRLIELNSLVLDCTKRLGTGG
jgi:hypothetical protein